MKGTLVLAAWEVRRAVRTRWVLGGGIAFAAGASAVALLGLESARELGLSGAGPASAGLIGFAMLLTPLLGLLLGASSIAGARERGILGMILVQPLATRSVVGGFFLGALGALWLIILVGLGAAGVIFGAVADASDVGALIAIAASTLAVAAASVAIGVAISCMTEGQSQAAGWAVTIWFLMALGVDLALAGLGPSIRLGPSALLVVILLNPIETVRVLALLASDTQGIQLGPFGAYLDARFGDQGAAVVMLGALAIWVWVPLALAWWRLERRKDRA